MPRLTAELVAGSPQFMNPLKERELDLRGNSIPAIENLGAARVRCNPCAHVAARSVFLTHLFRSCPCSYFFKQDQFDCIDFTDNEIRRLENFPRMPRLKTLLLSNNNITRISPEIGSQIPNVETIMLTHNAIVNLSDIDGLSALAKLKKLDLRENNITKQPSYRLYVAARLPSLKWLDFEKIKDSERKEGLKMFKAELIKSDEALKANPIAAAERKALSPAEIASIKAAIAGAKTLAEVEKLEAQLREGIVPE
jgi:U2 small nuclear ribonucleoprotein A'